MIKVILDTSSLINFFDFLYRYEYSKIDIFSTKFDYILPILESVENVLEAFLLYDTVYVDEASLESTSIYGELYSLEGLGNCQYLSLDKSQEEIIYHRIFSKLRLEVDYVNDFFSLLNSERNMFMDPHNNYSLYNSKYFYPENYPYEYYESRLNAFKTMMENQNVCCDYKIEVDLPFYHMVRYLYYLELQRMTFSELVLHPNKNRLVQMFSGYKKIYSNAIIDQYEPLRAKLYNREVKWLGVEDNSLLIPMVASYVLTRCSQREDFFKIMTEVRNSKEAKSFRKGLSELVEKVTQRDIEGIDEILLSLEDARIRWNKSLNIHPTIRTKSITLSLPLISGIGIDVDIPYSMGNRTASRLLTFIHKMLINKGCRN